MMKWLQCIVAMLAVVLAPFSVSAAEADNEGVYQIGVGIADMTGPAAGVTMMGYGKLSQTSSGIHFRQYSRAFIVADSSNSSRVVFVSIDAGMVSQLVKLEVLKRLQEKYGNLYTADNVCISATHTHSAPGGFLQYVLYNIPSQGFVEQSYQSHVEGIVKSIERAHESMAPGYIYWNKGELLDANINRSPTAYENNPKEEKARYKYNVDKDMILLKFTDTNNHPRGVINWFAVHATSMNNTNQLISGDNKGYASLLFEQDMNEGELPGKGPFVAAFAQSNEGDVSPNTKGPRCIDTGLACDANTSTCEGKNEKCIAFGPGEDMFESTRIIGEKQYHLARVLFESATEKVTGPVDSIAQTVDMSNVMVTLGNNESGYYCYIGFCEKVKTCKPAMGYSFAAGTTDGPGDFDFKQGTTSTSPFWSLLIGFIRRPSAELKACQEPKPILLPTGEISYPYEWQPTILPTQILRIGEVLILSIPAEFTTMSGRRIRDAVKNEFAIGGVNKTIPVVAGLANAYSSYVATYEEYQVQRYEGASTIFGPHTLDAYIQQFRMLASNLVSKHKIERGPEEPNLYNRQISLNPGVIYDTAPFRKEFGDVLHDVDSEYKPGDTVSVTFVSGHPRNDLQLEGTFLTVERKDPESGEWKVVATDANWETRFYWKRTSTLFGESEATVTWDIPSNVESGEYRIQHFGHRKTITQKIHSYTGVSSTFTVKS